ncbi:MAG: glycoside hydrolase family 31 protein [Bacilli bacterium]|nr:glycoside hydrolase family 31 protein [Bacilli bacterium]
MNFSKLLSYEIDNQIVKLVFEKQPLYLTFIAPGVIRVSTNRQIKSHAVKDVKSTPVIINVVSEEPLEFSTALIKVRVNDGAKISFLTTATNDKICCDCREEASLFKNKKIRIYKETAPDEVFYGLGETGGFFNKKHYSYILWNTDNPDPHTENNQSLYKSVPFYIGLHNGLIYGIFYDNPYKSYFDFGKTDPSVCAYAAADGELDYYFIYGDCIGAIVKGYTDLTGRTPLPQIWTLGYHQCRWSYRDESEIRELVARFRKNAIPLDVVYLDIDYMDEYKVFTVNKTQFPDLSGLISDLSRQGVKAVAIVDPGVKIEPGYPVYEAGKKLGYFAVTPAGAIYQNVVWPGPAVYPSFLKKEVREWWQQQLRGLLDKGVRGIWNDMNEPASFAGPLPDDVVFPGDEKDYQHREVHNVYGHYMAQATYEGLKEYDQRRPFVITRACYAGSQKYSTVWTGDNHSIWSHLQMAIPQICNLGLSGLAFCGVDIGGFGSDVTKELLIRWVEAGCFFPLFRNHSASGTRRQEPWTFDRETLEIYRRYVRLRYRFIPYLYDLFYHHQKDGSPIIRPLVYHYPNDINTYDINDQYLVGATLLVAPVVEVGKRNRIVYLPEGIWYDYRTRKKYQSGYHIFDCPLDEVLMFVKNNSILVGTLVADYIDPAQHDTLIVEVYGDKAQYSHYYDDGVSFAYQNGDYQIYDISYQNEFLEISLRHSGHSAGYRRFIVNINGKEKEVTLNGGSRRLKI